MGTGPPNHDWLPEARLGSARAIGLALEACRGYLLAIANREMNPELQTKGGASDLVQETFLKAHRHFHRFQGDSEDELRAWLRRILLNHLADFRDLYQGTAKRQSGREVPVRSSLVSPNDQGHSPSGAVMEQEQDALVRQAVARLPQDYRTVLELRYQAGQAFEEIGTALGLTANAARKLWLRAVRRLRSDLENAT